MLEQEGELTALTDTMEMAVNLVVFAPMSATFFSFGKVFEAVGGTPLSFLMLLDVPGQFGGDIGDKITAGSQTMIMAPHAKLTVLVRTKALQRIVGELVSHIHQVVVGVNVVQAMRLSLPGCLTHIFAISKQTVEVELIGVFAVGGQTRIIVLKLQEARLDLRLGVFQRRGG